MREAGGGVEGNLTGDCNRVIGVRVVDLQEAEEGFCAEIGKLVMEGCFRIVDDVEPPSVMLFIPLCGIWVDEFVLWCVDLDRHDVGGEGISVQFPKHLLEFLDVQRWGL